MNKLTATAKVLASLADNPLLRDDDWKIIDQRLSQLVLTTAAGLMKKRPRRPRGANADQK